MQIIWFSRADKQWQDAMDYCEDHFGIKAADRFYEKILHLNTLLSINPYLGAIEERLSEKVEHWPVVYRSIVVDHNYKLIYRIDESADVLYVVALWDCRSNPLRMYDEIGSDWPTSMVNEERVPYGKKAE